MTIDDIHKDLSNCVRWDLTEEVSKILKSSEDLDLTYDNGSFFITPIDNDNFQIFEEFVQYYEKNVLSKKEGTEYLLAKHQLKKIFQEAQETCTISGDIQAILDNYTLTNNSKGINCDEAEQDLSGFSVCDETPQTSFDSSIKLSPESLSDDIYQCIGVVQEIDLLP